MASNPHAPLPRWIDIGLMPILNVIIAFIFSGFIIWVVMDQSPILAIETIFKGAFGTDGEIGYTLYYTTNYIFTGLAVAIAFHAGLFNIGGEGQAYIGGLGVALVVLSLDAYVPAYLLIPLAVLASALFGALWGLIPGILQAYRGSHIVITTIMFNFIAYSLMQYMVIDVFRAPGQMDSISRDFASSATMPSLNTLFAPLGITMFNNSPANISFFLALLVAFLVWVFLWHTRWGYAIRTVGFNKKAAIYGGINPKLIIVVAMCISGAIAGLLGVNALLGDQHRLLLDYQLGFGFAGIAVALMGRNHPFGIILASLLFGILLQGGSELAFDNPAFTKEMITVIQGLIILFAGALSLMIRPLVVRIYSSFPSANKRRA